jgi:ribosome-associated protein
VIGLRGDARPATLPAPTQAPAMSRLTFELDREFVELNQLLKLVGLCDSGGAGKALVASGAVTVDGEIEHRKTCKIRAGQHVAVEGVEIHVVAVDD